MHTVIWFAQFIKEQIRIIDFYYDCKGLGLPKHAAMLQQKGYVYGEHFAPHDIEGSNAKSFQTGKYTMDVAKGLDINFRVVEKHRIEDGLAAVRDVIRLSLFNKPKTEEGILGLSTYRRQLNPTLSTTDKPVYYEQAVKDWTRHVADAFRTLAMAFRYSLRINGQLIGYPGALRNHGYDDLFDNDDDFDDLRHGLTDGFDDLRHGLVRSTRPLRGWGY